MALSLIGNAHARTRTYAYGKRRIKKSIRENVG